MSGFLALGNDQYVGTYKLDQTEGVKVGTFVSLDHAKKTGKLTTAATGAGEVWFVANENDSVIEHNMDDINFLVKNGEYLRLHKPQAGEVLVTTEFSGTVAEGDTVVAGANGVVAKAAADSTAVTKFVVKAKTMEFGVDTLRLLAL